MAEVQGSGFAGQTIKIIVLINIIATMKYLITFLLSVCLSSSYCFAQALEDDPVVVADNKSRPTPQTLIAVTFVPTDTCNLVINGRDYGEVAKNSAKTIRLYPGSHRLFFESLETGEAIKKRSFRITRDSARGGKYTYPVMFKQH